MKKIILTAALSLIAVLAATSVDAWFGRGRARGGCGPCGAPAVSAPCAPVCEEQQPMCTKNVLVPRVVQDVEVVQVPALEVFTPVAPTVVCRPGGWRKVIIQQPPIQQPPICKFERLPDTYECVENAPIRSFECPVGTNENPSSEACGSCPAA